MARRLVQMSLTLARMSGIGAAIYGGAVGQLGFLLGGIGFAGIAVWLLRRVPAPPPPPREPVLPPAPDQVYLDIAAAHDLGTGAAFAARINAIAPRAKLPMLGLADLARLGDVIDARQRKQDQFRLSPPIAVIRQARRGIDITRDGTSWLGGLPHLGDTPWPRSAQDVPLHHLAQIALEDLPDHALPPELPRAGNLCFFVDSATGHKVLHIAPHSMGPTALPADLPPIAAGPEHDDQTTMPPVFARWPVGFHPLPAKDSTTAMALSFGDDKGGTPDADSYAVTAPALARPWLWDTAHRVIHALMQAEHDIPRTIAAARARVADHGDRYAAELAFLIENETAFRRYVQAAAKWVAGRDRFTPMDPEDIALLETLFGQISTRPNRQPGFALFYRYARGQITRLRDARNATLMVLARGEPAVYALLPEPVKADLDAHHRLPSQGRWHQMFGAARDGQAQTGVHAHDHMLLQLHADALVGWGDMGVIRFWISTDDLAARRWDAVAVTRQST
jgi:hypothetical protein